MIKTNESERVKQQWITVGKPKVISLFDLAKGFPKQVILFSGHIFFMWSYRATLLPIVGIPKYSPPKGHDNICNYISDFLQVFQNNSIENVPYFLRIEPLLAGVGSENSLCKRDVCGVDEFIAQFFFFDSVPATKVGLQAVCPGRCLPETSRKNLQHSVSISAQNYII